RGTRARLCRRTKTHASRGDDPFAGAAPPAYVRPAESLRAFVVLTFPRPTGAFAERDARCGAAAAVARALGHRAFIPHPYPITPYHDDYVAHVDLEQQARERAPGGL